MDDGEIADLDEEFWINFVERYNLNEAEVLVQVVQDLLHEGTYIDGNGEYQAKEIVFLTMLAYRDRLEQEAALDATPDFNARKK